MFGTSGRGSEPQNLGPRTCAHPASEQQVERGALNLDGSESFHSFETVPHVSLIQKSNLEAHPVMLLRAWVQGSKKKSPGGPQVIRLLYALVRLESMPFAIEPMSCPIKL